MFWKKNVLTIHLRIVWGLSSDTGRIAFTHSSSANPMCLRKANCLSRFGKAGAQVSDVDSIKSLGTARRQFLIHESFDAREDVVFRQRG
jgi:hypothetical protein